MPLFPGIAFLIYVYYFLAIVAVWLGVQSLLSGLRYAFYIVRECARSIPVFTPYVSVILPCRGLHYGFRENLEAVFQQDYPSYEIIFVTDDAADPSVSVIEELRQFHQHVPSRVLFAGPAIESGQKVHNLRQAVKEINDSSEVLVFVDADARPGPHWLRSLVAPLVDQELGATTGYRWFLSRNASPAAQLLSVWNASIASALGERSEKNFCWGGSTAIRRLTFESLCVAEHWRGSVSDDFTMMRVLRDARLPIKFVPACLTASFEQVNIRQLLEFTNRQLQITRVYAPQLWKAALVGGLFFNSVFFGGLLLVTVLIASGRSFIPSLLLLGTVFLLGTAKAFIRWRAVFIPLAEYRRELYASLPAHVLLWPLGALLFLCNSIVAATSRRIVWRGIAYELKSPTEAVIISRDQ